REALEVATEAGRFSREPVVIAPSHGIRMGPASPQPPRGVDLLLDGLAALVSEGHTGAVPVLKRALHSLEGERESEGLSLGAATALNLWDDGTARALASRQKELSVRAGALIDLQRSLVTLARLSILAGDCG